MEKELIITVTKGGQIMLDQRNREDGGDGQTVVIDNWADLTRLEKAIAQAQNLLPEDSGLTE